MQIVCPHCSTSYAINLATLGAAGRTVRCSRCKEVWLARPEDAIEVPTPAMAEAGREAAEQGAAAGWDTLARQEDGEVSQPPHIDSPSIAGDWSNSAQDRALTSGANWPSAADNDLRDTAA